MNPPQCPFCAAQTARFGTKNGYELYECGMCDLLFVHPIPRDLATIYGEDYFRKDGAITSHGYTDYDKDKEPMRHVFEKYIARCEKLTSGRRIFDVGAATGYVLDIAKRRGWTTFGSELSEYAGQEAGSRGHAITIGKLITAPMLPTVDAVMMWDVLEHVDDPRAYVKKMHDMLVERGVLMISTPDRSSWWAKLMGMKWQLIIPPEHLYYYSPRNLTKLLQDSGFKVLEVAKPSKRFSIPYVFSMLAQWQGLSLWKTLARLTDNKMFRSVVLPINLRDNMFIVAVKQR